MERGAAVVVVCSWKEEQLLLLFVCLWKEEQLLLLFVHGKRSSCCLFMERGAAVVVCLWKEEQLLLLFVCLWKEEQLFAATWFRWNELSGIKNLGAEPEPEPDCTDRKCPLVLPIMPGGNSLRCYCHV